MRSFERYAVQGIVANRSRIDNNLHQSLMLVTALVPHLGYDRAAVIAQRAFEQNSTLAEAALALGYAQAQDLVQWLQPSRMLGPELAPQVNAPKQS
jgi:fumarate hydratase class II